MSPRLRSAAIGALIAIWFLSQTGKGLWVDFSEDDLMNMYGAWVLPLPKLLLANLTPFTSVYRPLGSLFYRAIYEIAGLHPLPFRVAAYVLLLLNIWLVYRLVCLLTGSAEIAILTALLFSYHKRLFGLFVNGGTIYDVLCFTFFCLAFWSYVSARRTSGTVSGFQLLGFCALFTLALNSKEMAAALPAILLAYEVIYHPPSRRGWRRWLYERYALWIAAAITAIAFEFRQTTASSFHGIPDYKIVFSLHRYFQTTVPLVSQLFFLSEDSLNEIKMLVLFVLLWTAALAARNKTLMLSAAIIVLAPLPINFIAYRGFFVMYLPLLGWALYFATALVVLKDSIAARTQPVIPATAVLFLATAGVLFMVEYRDDAWSFEIVDVKQVLIRGMRRDLAGIRTALPRNARVLLLKQAFEPDSYNPLYIVRLKYHDPGIAVDCAQSSRAPQPIRPEKYHLVLNYCGEHYIEVGRSACAASME